MFKYVEFVFERKYAKDITCSAAAFLFVVLNLGEKRPYWKEKLSLWYWNYLSLNRFCLRDRAYCEENFFILMADDSLKLPIELF